MNIDLQRIDHQERIEKYILRKALMFWWARSKAVSSRSYFYRQKEQFSDGVGYGWIDALKDNAELHVTDEMMKNPKPEWGTDIPDSKERKYLICF